MTPRRVRVAPLPEMRLAYFQGAGDAEGADRTWQLLNEWRLGQRPQLGRIDVAAIGWFEPLDEGGFAFRAGVPVRSDYPVHPPASPMLFAARNFAYLSADDGDEYEAAFEAVLDEIERQGLDPLSGPVEVHRYHFNLDQHPADCGFFVSGELPAAGGHDRPLPIAPRG
ncbi:MAG: hypothetical protein ACM3S1_11450 [Hyphomicrobiales bacterium]